MKSKKGNQKRSTYSWTSRLMAMVLALTLAFTSSGFTSLAEDLGEGSTEASAVTVEVQEAEAAAAEQAAAEQAAAEQAAAEQAAAEQAAAEAAAAEQAAAEQAAAEQAAAEAAAAEQAAAEQAAAEAAAAEQAAAEEAAAAEQAEAPAEEAPAEEAAEEAAAEEPAEADTEEPTEEEEETEVESETEEWDGYFTNEHPEWGGVLVIELEGAYPCTIKVTIPENAFTDPINASASIAMYTTETIGEERLDAILAAAGVDPEETDIYDLYMVDLSFTNEDGDKVEPASAVTVKVDTSEEPVDIGAGDVETELTAGIYHYNEEITAADKVSDKVAFDEGNKITGIKFSSEWFSPFFVLATAEPEDEEESEAGIKTLDAGDVYNVTYSTNMEDIVEFADAPETVEDGDTLTFSVIVPDGYGFESVIATEGENETPLGAFDSIDIEDGARYEQWYEYTGAEEDGIHEDVEVVVTAYKGQIIDGYGTIEVFDQETQSDFTVTIKDVPTNTPVSLSYREIDITDKSGNPVSNTMTGRLYYVPDGEEENTDNWVAISYFMLDGNSKQGTGKDENGNEITYFKVVPYAADNTPYDITKLKGSLYLKNTAIVSARADIMPLQDNMLCSLDENGDYQQEFVGAAEMSSNMQTYYYPGYEGDAIAVTNLTNGKVDTFYYGELGEEDEYGYYDISSLNECEYLEIVNVGEGESGVVEYELWPLDENGNVVDLEETGYSLYMEYDQVYSFDVVVKSIVNEHTEDNGDVYLWHGNTYYVDQYKNQGYDYVPGYTRSQNTLTNCGIWVQLARIREPLINDAISSGTSAEDAFGEYANVSYQNMLDEGVDLNGYDAQNAKDTAEANAPYGIVGPYTIEDGTEGVWELDPVRVTGHVGDEFVAADALGADIVYMIPNDEAHEEAYHDEWINLGAHASDNGYRSWFYWINDYYKLNDNEDELQYVEIVERDDGEIHLEADEMGTEGLGEEYDIWNTDFYVKRDSIVKTHMQENQEELKKNNVGFDYRIDTMNHIQLRMDGTVEIINPEDGKTYFGKLSVLTGDDSEENTLSPYISYKIYVYNPEDPSGEPIWISDEAYLAMENDQETQQLKFYDTNGNGGYYSFVDRFDTDLVQIYVSINFEGTLSSVDGDEIVYTKDNPFTYEGYLTEAQLKEGYDTCPVYNGYDVAISISDAVQQDISVDTEIILYKVWDDSSDLYDSRGNVEDIVITLERSEDGKTWETVLNDMEDPDSGAKEFTISAPVDPDTGEQDLTANQWSLVLTEDDLDLTFGEGEELGYYEFRIASEAYGEGEDTNPDYTYNTVITGTSVTNTLRLDETEISGEKLWYDTDGETPLADADIPDTSVIITLYQNGHYYDRQTLSKDAGWEFEFSDLPVWNGGEKYVYTLGEMTSDGRSVGDGDSILLGQDWFHVEIEETVDEDGESTYEFKNVKNPPVVKDEDSDGDGEYGDTGNGVQVGDTITYKIDCENYLNVDATVTITDVLDEGLDYVDGSASDGGTYDSETRTITWVIEAEPKQEISVTFDAVVNYDALDRNEVENTASVQVNDNPAVDTNTVYNPVPDKDVDADEDGVFEDSGMYVAVGSTVTYKIDYENPDDDPATVTITDEVDVGLDFVSATDDGSYNESNRTITWTIENVDPHTNGSVYFTATVNENATDKMEVDNTAFVKVGNHDGQQTKTVYNPLVPESEKGVDTNGDEVYDDNGNGVKVGDTVTYEITYENYYDQEATVVITDVVDEGLDYVEDSATKGGVYDEKTRTITWEFKAQAGESGSVIFSGIVNKTALVRNEIDNTAEVKVDDDPTVKTNTVYNPVPDKDVDADEDGVFEDSGMYVAVGSTVTYKIDYENPDDDPADVTITDEVDIGLDFVSATDNGSYNESDRTITWTIEDVDPHTRGSVYFTATVNENATDKMEVDNTAFVQVGNHDGQQTKTVYNPLVPESEKDVDVEGKGTDFGDNGVSVQVGDTVTYEITYENYYDQEATVVITDVVDEGLDYVKDSATKGGVYDEETRTITWEFKAQAGESGSVTFSGIVNETALVRNEIDNTAEVKVDDDPTVKTNTVYNPVPDKDVDADGDEVFEDSGMLTTVGATLVYKIDYENPDDDPATVTITDEVDIGLDFESATDGGSYDDDARLITWTIEDVDPHTNGSVYFTATVNENATEAGYVKNTAVVQVGNHEEQQTKTVYNPVPDKGVDTTGDGVYDDNGESLQVGDTVSYEIKYFNGYEKSATVTITDVLDEGLTYVSSDPEAEYNESTHTLTWVIEDVASLTGDSVTFTATVNENALERNVVDNTAKVQVGDDPNTEVETKPTHNPVPDKDVDANEDQIYEDSGMLTTVGATLVYKIDYQNPDDEAATVTITDEVDEGLDFVSATDGGVYDEETRTIIWTLEGVASQTNGSVYFTATVNENATKVGYVENTAVVQVGNHEEQQTKTVYNPVPGKGVDTDEDGEYDDNGESLQVGDTVSYEIVYFNGYEDPATVTITDVLDDGLTYKSSEPAATVSTNEEGKTVLTWVIEDVEPQSGDSVTFTATVNENALVRNVVDNTATVQVGDDPETAMETNPTHNPVPDKDVDADGDEVFEDSGMLTTVGATLVYKIDYQNPDDEAATVTITDEVDVGLDFVSATDGGKYDEGTRTITWILEGVAAQTNGSVYFTATVNENATEAGYVKNTAVVQVGNHEEQQTKTVYNPIPDKDVDANADGTYGDNGLGVNVGDTLTYTIDYFNGYDLASTVIITDELDEGLSYVEESAGEYASYDEETHTITWTIPNVAALSGGSVTFQAVVNEGALVKNEVENTATVEIGENSADTNTVYNPVPDKDVDADGDGEYGDSGMEVLVGSTLTYIIYYENPDDVPAVVTITDVLDEGLDFIEASDEGEYDTDTRTITWVIEDVPAHTNGSVTFDATVNEDALIRSVVENTATVQVGDHPEQETRKVWNPLKPGKDVDADADGSYGDSGEDVEVGDTLTYIINYFNDTEKLETVIITDVLDEGLNFVSASDGGVYDDETRTITWAIPDVESLTGGSVTFEAVVNESARQEDDIENTAEIVIGNNTYTTNTVDNPTPYKDVDIHGDGTYGDSGLGVKVGDVLTYKIDYFNGYDVAKDITITDVLDEGLDFIGASDGGEYDADTRTITWIITDVEGMTPGSVTFTATVNETALIRNEVENTASVQVGDDPAIDTNTVYNPVPDKDVDIHGDESWGDSGLQVDVGDTLTYIIYYENPDDDAATVTITDVLDIGLDYVSASDEGTYDAETRTITWVIEGVEAHTNGSVTFTATVNEDARVKNEVDNTATVQVGEHPDMQTKTVYNPIPGKDIDADGNGEYGDSGVGVHVGDTVTYEIGYFNGYDEPAAVTITDTLDLDKLEYVDGSASDGGVYEDGMITWTMEDVPAQSGGTVTFQAKVLEGALETNEIDNTATVQVNDDPKETNTVYNPVPHKDVDADENSIYGDSGMLVPVGRELTYEIQYENPYDTAEIVTITDVLDEGLDFNEASNDGSYDEDTRTITWAVETPAHSNGSVTFKATVNEKALEKGEVVNTATVQVGEHPAQNTETVVNPVPTKDVDTGEDESYGDNGVKVAVGDTLTYKITYKNAYDEAAVVTIVDELDEHVKYVRASASNGGNYDDETHTITWKLNVPAQTEGEVTYKVTVLESALTPGEVENTATVKVGDHAEVKTNKVENPVEPEPEPTPEPEPEPEPDDEPTAPRKYVDADGDDDFHDNKQEVSVGDELTYKIRFYNNHAYADVVTITDTLDENVEYVEGSASDDGFYDEATRTITWYVGTDAFTKGEVTFKVKVLSEAEKAGAVYNKATVQIGSDEAQETNEVENPVKGTSSSSNPTSGSGTSTTPSSSSGSGTTASSVKTADETPVGPIAGLMIAALAMMLAAFTYRRRRASSK